MSVGIEQLKGSIPPLITPFRNGEIDLEGYAGLVNFQVEQGSHGILVNGTTSEPSTLTVEERNRLIDVAMEKGNLNREEATNFWEEKKKDGQYIAVSLPGIIVWNLH